MLLNNNHFSIRRYVCMYTYGCTMYIHNIHVQCTYIIYMYVYVCMHMYRMYNVMHIILYPYAYILQYTYMQYHSSLTNICLVEFNLFAFNINIHNNYSKCTSMGGIHFYIG